MLFYFLSPCATIVWISLFLYSFFMMMHSKCKSAIMLVLGVLFLLGTMGVWPEFTLAKYWPVFFVLMGVHGLVCPCCPKPCGDKPCDKNDKSCENKPMAAGCCKSGGKGGVC